MAVFKNPEFAKAFDNHDLLNFSFTKKQLVKVFNNFSDDTDPWPFISILQNICKTQ